MRSDYRDDLENQPFTLKELGVFFAVLVLLMLMFIGSLRRTATVQTVRQHPPVVVDGER